MPSQPLVVEKPWGRFKQYTHNEVSTVKILEVEEGQALSWQSHERRDERWVVLDEGAAVQLHDDWIYPAVGDELFIPRGAKHRLASRKGRVRILEISFGDFDEEDIVRYADEYGRAPR